jgi:gas vesicle protein
MNTSQERVKGTTRFAFKSINKLKENKSEEFTIYLFFTYGKKRLKLSTGLKTCYNDWDFSKQRFKNRVHIKKKDSNNTTLTKLEESIQEVYNNLSEETSDITPAFLKNRLQLKLRNEVPRTKQAQKLTFSELVDIFINYKE